MNEEVMEGRKEGRKEGKKEGGRDGRREEGRGTQDERRNKKKTHCIPNLQLDLFSFDGYHASTEFHTNCQVVNGLEPLVCELQEKTRLSNTFVAESESKSAGVSLVSCVLVLVERN
jgi:hypothetical protein